MAVTRLMKYAHYRNPSLQHIASISQPTDPQQLLQAQPAMNTLRSRTNLRGWLPSKAAINTAGPVRQAGALSMGASDEGGQHPLLTCGLPQSPIQGHMSARISFTQYDPLPSCDPHAASPSQAPTSSIGDAWLPAKPPPSPIQFLDPMSTDELSGTWSPTRCTVTPSHPHATISSQAPVSPVDISMPHAESQPLSPSHFLYPIPTDNLSGIRLPLNPSSSNGEQCLSFIASSGPGSRQKTPGPAIGSDISPLPTSSQRTQSVSGRCKAGLKPRSARWRDAISMDPGHRPDSKYRSVSPTDTLAQAYLGSTDPGHCPDSKSRSASPADTLAQACRGSKALMRQRKVKVRSPFLHLPMSLLSTRYFREAQSIASAERFSLPILACGDTNGTRPAATGRLVKNHGIIDARILSVLCE
jgi:hypothetical protein